MNSINLSIKWFIAYVKWLHEGMKGNGLWKNNSFFQENIGLLEDNCFWQLGCVTCLRGKKQCSFPRGKWKSVVEREKERLSKLVSKFHFEIHMSTLALEQCFQKHNLSIMTFIGQLLLPGEFGLLLFYSISAKKKKIICGMFWLGSKLSKSFSFFFSWNSEIYLLPFWPKASSSLNLHCALLLCIPASLLFLILAQMTKCW